MTRAYDEPRPGRAKIRLDVRTLAEHLRLPENVRILTVVPSYDPVEINVVVESDALPEVPLEAESPFVHVQWTRTVDEHDREVVEFEYLWPEGSAL